MKTLVSKERISIGGYREKKILKEKAEELAKKQVELNLQPKYISTKDFVRQRLAKLKK